MSGKAIKKRKFVFLTTLAALMALIAAVQLRSGGLDNRASVLGWGFILIFCCVFVVRGVYAINRVK